MSQLVICERLNQFCEKKVSCVHTKPHEKGFICGETYCSFVERYVVCVECQSKKELTNDENES